MDNKINILFVAFEFPPLNGGGIQRSLKFVKYLSAFGINPIVITVKEEDGPLVMKGHANDHSMDNDIPPGTVIERVHCKTQSAPHNKFQKWARIYFSVTEVFKNTWKPALQEQLPRIIKEYKPQAVYISLPPFAMAPLWLDMMKGYNLPMIVDFRDAWTQWCLAPNGTYFHYLKKLSYEREIINHATKLVCTSNETRLDMLRVHPSVNADKFSVITNGYDGVLEWDQLKDIPHQGKIRIGYVGSFYYSPEARKQIFTAWWKKPLHRMLNYVPRKEDWSYRSPYFFLKTISQLLLHEPGWKDRIEIHFAGNKPAWLEAQITDFGLQDLCTHHGYLDHDSALAFQKKCDALLITSSRVIGGKDYSIAGKTFEYFTLGRPILAFVCDGAQKNILTETGMSLLCDPDNIESSVTALHNFFSGTIKFSPDKAAIKKYNRKLLTETLSTIIKEAISSHKNSRNNE